MSPTAVAAWVGAEIRRARIEKDRTQDELAKLLSDVGFRFSRATLARVEIGSRPVTVDELTFIALLLELPLERFLPAA